MALVRKIPVYGAPGSPPGTFVAVDVAPGSSFQAVRGSVAQQHSLDLGAVEIWVLQGKDRKRVIQSKLSSVPGPEQQIIAVVKAGTLQRATEMQLQPKRHVVTPNPVSMLQPTEGLRPVDCFAELFDNGIRAGASSLELKLVGGQQLGRQQHGEMTLTYVDNGSGMPRDVAENYLRMGYSNSGVVDAPRVIGQPLALASYFSKNMSRHGKGALALLYFGHKIVTHTKTAGSRSTTCVEFDLDKEIARYNTTKDPEYLATVTELLDLTDAPEVEAASFTETAISALQERVRPQLVDASRVADWAQQLASVYYFFIHGMPQQLWDTLPPELRVAPPAAAAAAANGTTSSQSRAAAAPSGGSSARPQGGLTLKLFGHSIDQQPPNSGCLLEPPPVAVMLQAFFKLQQQVQQEDGRQLLPLWLPVRWCEDGMSPDDEPRRAKPNPAYTVGLSQDGADDDDTDGVAGQLKGCFRDFLVLLLYFPRRRGVRTKPELYLQGRELCLFPIWSGRLIPEASCLKEMPAFVGEATSSGDASAFKLSTARLGGVVFCSPEVYTTNNKTNFKDDAYKVFMELGSSKPSSIDSSSRGRLFIWDSQARGNGRWIPGSQAKDLLLRHFNANWALLERDGQLLDGQQFGAERRGSKYKLADREDPLVAGALVRLRSAEEVRQADAVAVAGAGSPAGAAPAAPAGGRKKGRSASSQKIDLWPSAMGGPQFGIIVQFIDQGADSGQQHFVELREWAPDWVDAAGVPKRRLLISGISPLAATNAEADKQAQQLMQQWQREAPHHLAWYNARNSKPVERAEDLPDTHGNNAFAPSQVPDVLQVCFATQANDLAAMDKRKWGDQMALHKQHFSWEILRQQGGDHFEQVAAVTVKYFDSKTNTNKSKVQLGGEDGQGLSHYCQEAGGYKVTCRPVNAEDCPWVRQPLSWAFTVHDDQASNMVVSFAAPGPHKVRLGGPLPEVVVRLTDQTGRRLAMPFSSDELARAALKLVELRLRDDASGSLRIKLNQQQATIHLNTERTELCLKNLKVVPQSLGSDGSGMRRSEAQMKVWLKLQLPGRPTALEPQQPVDLAVQSGPPAKLVPDEPSLDASARGSRVVLPPVGILDAYGNCFCAGGQTFTATIAFDPPDSAKLKQDRAAAEPLELEQPDAAGAGSSAAAAAAAAGCATPPNRRKRSKPAAVRGSLPGLCSIDGNLIDLKSDYRWQAPPGSCPKVLLRLFNCHHDDILRQSKAVEPLLELELNAPMHDMFVVFDHRLISQDLQAAELATERRLVRQGKAARQQREEAYELNTGDGLQRVPLASGQSREFRLLPPQVVERLDLGYELRQDVVDGQLAHVFVAPDGCVLRPPQPGSPLVVPDSLVQHWNRVVARPLATFEVAFALSPDTPQLADLVIQACNARDQLDKDFTARIQVVRSAAPDELLFADLSSPLCIAGGQLRLPNINIDRSWFAFSSNGTATFTVRDADSGEGRQGGRYQLGRFHVRLLPAAERLLVMAAGKVFEGVHLTLLRGNERVERIAKRQLLTGRGQQSVGAWAPWELTNPSPRGASSSASARQVQEHIHPRSIVANSDKPLLVRLGQPVVLHFVATDLQGCPARLSQQQAAYMQQAGLQLRPAAASAATAATDPQEALRAEAVAWSCDGQQAAGTPLPPGHLGGYSVNAVTFKVLAGCGAAELVLTLPGNSRGTAELVVPLAVEAGPVAVDGLSLSVREQLPQQLQAGRAAAALSRAQLIGSRMVGLVDRHTWQEISLAEQQDDDQQPAAAAAAAAAADPMPGLEGPGAGTAAVGVAVKPEPGRESEEVQIASERRHRVVDVIDLVSSDPEEEEEEEEARQQPKEQQDQNVSLADLQDQQRQRQQQHRQQQLAGLDRSAAALLHTVTAHEGCRLLLQLQLRDAGGHAITSDSSDQQLQLVQHVGWQPSAAAPLLRTRPLQQVAFKSGRAELCLNVGLGDGWLGQQLFELQLAVSPGPAADGRGGSSSEVVSAVLPVLLQLDVLPGPFPCSLHAATDVIADLGCAVAEPTAAAAAAAEVALTAAQLARLGGQGLLRLFSSSCASVAQVAVLQPLSAADAATAGSSSNAAAAAASGSVTLPALGVRVAAHNGKPLAPDSLQPLLLRLLRWAPSAAAVEAAAADGGAAAQLAASCWQEVQLPDHPLQLTAALDYAADAGANAAVVFQAPAAAVELPSQAGLYRLEASYTVLQELQAEGLPAVPPLSIGPFLMLPGQPRALVTAQQLLQQQQQQRPPSSTRDPRRRGKLAAAAAAAGPAVLPTPGPVQTQIVLLKDVASTVTQQMRLLLVDSWGNACCPAAAQLLAAAADARPAADTAADADAAGASPARPAKRQRVDPAAAAAPSAGWQVQLLLCQAQQPGGPGSGQRSLDGQQQQQQPDETVVWTGSIGADGSVVVPTMQLGQLGLAAEGDYQLLARAVRLLPDAGSPGGAQASSVPELLLAAYTVVAEDQAALKRKQLRLRQAKADSAGRVQQLSGNVQQLQEHVDMQLMRLRELGAQRDTAEAAANATAARMQALGGAGQLQDQPHRLLRWSQRLLHPRAIAAGGGMAPATEVALSGLLPSNQSVQLVQNGAVLGPLVCLGAVEQQDVARLLSALVRSDLSMLVAVSGDAAEQLRRNRQQVLLLTHPQLVSDYPAHPSGAWQQLQRSNPRSFYLDHPQSLNPPGAHLQQLLSGLLEWDHYDPAAGFIGFADNLLRFNQQQLQVQVPVPGRYGANGHLVYDGRVPPVPLGLRQTLFYTKLANIMVFETYEHMAAFERRLTAQKNQALPRWLRLVALDGSTSNMRRGVVGHRLQLPDRPGDLLFAGLAAADVAGAGGPLDLRLRARWELQEQLQAQRAQVEELRQEQLQVNELLAEQRGQLAAAQQAQKREEAEAAQQQRLLDKQLREVELQLEQQARVARG